MTRSYLASLSVNRYLQDLLGICAGIALGWVTPLALEVSDGIDA